jgi:hypothetical protein
VNEGRPARLDDKTFHSVPAEDRGKRLRFEQRVATRATGRAPSKK